MDEIWHYGVVKYLQKKGLDPKHIHADMVATLGADAPDLSTVQEWAAELRSGREAVQGAERPATTSSGGSRHGVTP